MTTTIVFNRLLNGWFVVRGPHQTPLSGRFDTKAAALASLKPRAPRTPTPRANLRLLDADTWQEGDDSVAALFGRGRG